MQNFLKKFIPQKDDSKSELKRKIILLSALFLLIVCIAALIFIFAGEERDKKLNEELSDLHNENTTVKVVTTAPPATTTVPTVTEPDVTTTPAPPPPLEISPDMQIFLDENPDSAGWINVPSGVDNIIMQTDNNEKYLDKDFDGHYSDAGTIFADFRCVINDYDENQSDNIVLYGHNQKNQTMFGTLKKYKITRANNAGFKYYKENPTFTFSNLYKTYTYKIIAIFVIEVEPRQNPSGVIFDYHNYVNFSKNGIYTYDKWQTNINAHTALDTGVEFNEDDKFITLSTCSNEFEPSRLVVVGRRVRDGEDASVDTSKASINADAIEPDLAFIYNY
jgi:SrtB family sortase